ncbi:MAG: hypothetical protein QM755_00745 [Luteolibacter sp.]
MAQRIRQGLALGMRSTGGVMPATADQHAVLHDHRANGRIGRGTPHSLARFGKGESHPVRIVHGSSFGIPRDRSKPCESKLKAVPISSMVEEL